MFKIYQGQLYQIIKLNISNLKLSIILLLPFHLFLTLLSIIKNKIFNVIIIIKSPNNLKGFKIHQNIPKTQYIYRVL